MNNKVRSYVGFAIRSGQCVFGYDLIFKSGKVLVVLYSADMSDKAQIRLKRYCDDCAIPCIKLSEDDMQLYTSRPAVKAIGITEPNLAQAIIDAVTTDVDPVGI